MPRGEDQKLMTFGEHLEELRRRLILMLVGLVLALVVCWVWFRFDLYKLLWWPMRLALERAQAGVVTSRPAILDPVFTNPADAFMTLFRTTFVAAFVIASPWIFYQLWAFLSAGLYRRERRYVYLLAPFSVSLFAGGVLFCYFVLMPFGLKFLVSEGVRMGAQPLMSVNEYFSFSLTLLLVFGLAFQLPLVMMFLVKTGIVALKTFKRRRRHAILALVIVAAVVTPTTDIVSQLLLAGPLIALYELGILMARVRLGGRPARRRPPGSEETA